jgi:hypothetical protein
MPEKMLSHVPTEERGGTRLNLPIERACYKLTEENTLQNLGVETPSYRKHDDGAHLLGRAELSIVFLSHSPTISLVLWFMQPQLRGWTGAAPPPNQTPIQYWSRVIHIFHLGVKFQKYFKRATDARQVASFSR